MFRKILSEASKLGLRDKHGKLHLPVDHQAGMKVPKGGSMCANCRFYEPGHGKHGRCHEKNFIEWNKSDLIPEPADEYCSDFYRPKH